MEDGELTAPTKVKAKKEKAVKAKKEKVVVADKKPRSKLTDNPDVSECDFMTAFTAVSKEGVATPAQVRKELGRPIGASYHQKLMKAAKAAVTSGKIVIAPVEGKRTFVFKVA
jgi:hypothetical protein